MLEILLLINLGKKIAAKARDKGHSGPAFVILLLVLWFGFEIASMIAAMLIMGDKDDDFPLAYLAALVGAAVGGVLAFAIVSVLPNLKDDYDDESDDDDYDYDRDRR